MLLDRVEEREILDGLLSSARTGLSGTLVLRGEPGVGKTALLEHVVSEAGDMNVARVAGFGSETALGFAALHRLLRPFLGGRDLLPAPQRDAMGAAFGLSAASPADRFLVGLATLTLLADVATRRPLLCVIDDAHWLDRESAEVLAFVGRRLHADAIALIIASSDGVPGSDPFEGLPVMRLVGLPNVEALELLQASGADLFDQQTAERIVRETGANPLALIEFARAAETGELGLESWALEPMPIAGRLEEHFLGQVRMLSEASQLMLLIAAADATGDRETLWRAADHLAVAPHAATAAEASGLVALRPRVSFRHGLVRSAVYNGAAQDDRARVHRALAAVVTGDSDADRRAWHLAAAADGPDESVAAELERCAERARRRGGWSAEADFLSRAAELTLNSELRAERMLAAADAAMTSSLHHRSERLLALAEPALQAALPRAKAMRLRGTILRESRTAASVPVLLEAARALEPVDIRLARETLLEAFEAELMARAHGVGATDLDIAHAVQALGSPSPGDATTVDLLLDALVTRVAVGYAAAVPLFRKAVAAMSGDPSLADYESRWVLLGGAAANEVWDFDARAAFLSKVVRSARDRGALVGLRAALMSVGDVELRAGRFTAAATAYDEASSVTAAVGSPMNPAAIGILLHAWRGHDAETRAAATGLRAVADAQGIGSLRNIAAHALVVLELGGGRYEDALATAQPVYLDDALSAGNAMLPNLIEAGARSGDLTLAHAALERLSERATASGTSWALGLLARSRALFADAHEAEGLYRQALEHLIPTPVATDVARAHLLYGEWLRRERRRVDARPQLRTAQRMFAEMGADGFAERARIELAATGERARKRTVDSQLDLTPQEKQIAGLAAQGEMNAEIAARLFVSASTVDYHLRKVYRKLNISSRRQLKQAMGA